MRELMRFALLNYPPAKKWSPKVLANYIMWAAYHNFLFIARDDPEANNVKGVALARPVNKFPETDSEFDVDGKTIHVDVMAATDKRAFQLLCFNILKHYPNCDTITFQRLHRGTNRKKYSVEHVRKALLKTQKLIYG